MTMTEKQTGPRLARGVGCAALATLLAGAPGCTTPSAADTASVESQPAATPAARAAAAQPVVIEPRPGTERLARSVHRFATLDRDQGRLDPEKRITNLSLYFRASDAQRRDRDALAAAQLDPESPSFRKWLVPETYKARFGARPEDIARVTAWLKAQGFEFHRTSPLGNRVTFSAKVGALEAAFQTEMHRYLVGKEMHYAMALPPAMPSELAGVVLGIRHTHDFFPKPLAAKYVASAFAKATPAPTNPDYAFSYYDGGPDGSVFNVLGPADWAAAYDVTKLYNPGINGTPLDGTGVTIGIVGEAQIAQSDIDAFRKTFGLPQRTITMTLVPDTGEPVGGQGGAGIEAIIDTEWSGGIAKGADINYVYVGADDGDVDDGTIFLIEQNLGGVMSESYGGCEYGILPSDADIAEEYGTAANIMGITYMSATGDSGADGCLDFGLLGVSAGTPGDFPGVTGVGGTQWPTPGWTKAGDLTGYPTPELVWDEANNPFATYTYMGMTEQIGVGAGSGGISSVFARPAYQKNLPACDVIGSLLMPVSGPMRQTPDISVSAASGTPGYYIQCTPDQQTEDCAANGSAKTIGIQVGGTSASSPSFTGVIAILNQAVGTRVGNINPMLYQLEAANLSPSPFHDITGGSNAIVCGPAAADAGGPPDGSTWPDSGCAPSGLQGYNAGPGYDCASGIGSIDGFNLVSAWIGAVPTTTVVVPAPNTGVTEGEPVTLTATISVAKPNTNAVTGTVTYAFESFLPGDGGIDQRWELGSASITGGSVSGGTAVLSTNVPPGLSKPGHQSVDVVAFYGGDLYHLASSSVVATVNFAPTDFAIVPYNSALKPNDETTYTTTGGVSPVKWYILIDTTTLYSPQGQYEGGSYIFEDTGVFIAGPQAGYVEIQAYDKDGAEALAYITVGAAEPPLPWSVDAGPIDIIDASVYDGAVDASGMTSSSAQSTGQHSTSAFTEPSSSAASSTGSSSADAGNPIMPVADAGNATPHDAAGKDGGEDTNPAGGNGCGCVVAGGRPTPRTPLGAVGGLLLGLGLVVRRRQRS